MAIKDDLLIKEKGNKIYVAYIGKIPKLKTIGDYRNFWVNGVEKEIRSMFTGNLLFPVQWWVPFTNKQYIIINKESE